MSLLLRAIARFRAWGGTNKRNCADSFYSDLRPGLSSRMGIWWPVALADNVLCIHYAYNRRKLL